MMNENIIHCKGVLFVNGKSVSFHDYSCEQIEAIENCVRHTITDDFQFFESCIDKDIDYDDTTLDYDNLEGYPYALLLNVDKKSIEPFLNKKNVIVPTECDEKPWGKVQLYIEILSSKDYYDCICLINSVLKIKDENQSTNNKVENNSAHVKTETPKESQLNVKKESKDTEEKKEKKENIKIKQVRCCTLCRKPGHNKSSCPNK